MSETKALLLIGDSDTRNQIFEALSGTTAGVVSASSVEEAKRLDLDDVDLVIADASTEHLPLIRSIATEGRAACLLIDETGSSSALSAAMEVGIHGYMKLPVGPREVALNARHALMLRRNELRNEERHRDLERMVNDRTSELWQAVTQIEKVREELNSSREETIERLVLAAELKDGELRPHLERMSRYCGLLAKRAGLDEQLANTIRVASLMHDIGKAGLPEAVLLKEGKFRPAERETAKAHCLIGHQILDGSRSELIQMAATIALTHHERWDGSGYPRGLSGASIPLPGRIAAVADAFDALTTDRRYRKAVHLQKAVDVLRDGRSTHFDPRLVDLFLDSIDDVLRIMERHPDVTSPASPAFT
ncbi:MAG: HD-GYP domain-containing protein [Actinomycetota bacterium]